MKISMGTKIGFHGIASSKLFGHYLEDLNLYLKNAATDAQAFVREKGGTTGAMDK